MIDNIKLMAENPGYSGNQFFGHNYQAGRDVKDIAKLVRKDIALAIKAGDLPTGLKTSVRIDRFSGGCSCDVSVTAFPGPILNPERLAKELADPNEYLPNFHYPRYTPEVTATLSQLNSILNSYKRDDSNSQIDYFSVNFYGHVQVDYMLEAAERDAAKAVMS